ncbi:alpha-2,8-sialyltransferase 8B-like [Antedon mediterranea]|uniref:alpha-2,8-sialyltransferase 8B-like n=1 Tax=Antedon mediterranea TaxID=105859 RepID=UPI003AF598D6
MMAKLKPAYVVLGIIYVLLISGLTFQYMSSRKWLYTTNRMLYSLKINKNNSQFLRPASPASSKRNHNIWSSTPKARPSPTSSGDVFIDWSNINMTSVENMREKIKKYMDGKLSLIVYKHNTSLTDMKFDTNLTQLKKANSTEFLQHHDTCAIIGNSGILLNSGCGREIDAHDLVVRANSARILGFESDVGKKTSIMAFNRASAIQLKRRLGGKRMVLDSHQLKTFRTFKNTIMWYPLGAGGTGTAALKAVGMQLGFDNIRIGYSLSSPMRLSKTLWHLRLPSSGINMFSAMNYYCDKISLYGFFPFYEDTHGRPIQHHYYETVVYNYTHSHHKMPQEYVSLTQLNKDGVVRLVTDRCNY